MRKRIVLVGGGPAGYVSAIHAAQLGAEVHLVEAAKLGGTCLNVGCIPTKALLYVAEFYHQAKMGMPGVKSSAELDWPGAMAHKNALVDRLTGGVSWLLQRNQVKLHPGQGVLLPGLRVRVGGDILEGDAVILATGSSPITLPFPGHDLPGVIDSTEALSLDEPPGSMVIVGGGVIGVEIAALYARVGTKVTIIEAMPEILPNLDEEIAGLLREKLQADGIRIFVKTRLSCVEEDRGGLRVSIEASAEGAPGSLQADNAPESLQADKVLVAVGRKANTSGLGLEAIGLATDRAAVLVDAHGQTSVPGVYAIGDCNAKAMLAHAAMAQGIGAVRHIMGLAPVGKPENIPACVYTSPQIASVGMTEKQIQDKGIAYVAGRFPLTGNAKAVIEGEDGLIKILAGKSYGEVLGVHMIGPKVTEQIAAPSIFMGLEGTVEDMAHAIYAHPTLSESLGEAALAALGLGLHQAPS